MRSAWAKDIAIQALLFFQLKSRRVEAWRWEKRFFMEIKVEQIKNDKFKENFDSVSEFLTFTCVAALASQDGSHCKRSSICSWR